MKVPFKNTHTHTHSRGRVVTWSLDREPLHFPSIPHQTLMKCKGAHSLPIALMALAEGLKTNPAAIAGAAGGCDLRDRA